MLRVELVAVSSVGHRNMTLRTNGSCIAIDKESNQPHCQPLKTVQEVLSWKASREATFCPQYATSKKFVRPSSTRTKPYTLVCHDFKGGYLEDRYLQGGAKKDAYYFCRWECIDIFVYFSHHFVTVPPVGWTCAAHKHGTMILGTIITEWHDGAALWSEVLSSKDMMQELVSRLVEICDYHGFDGWLVNVENKIEEAQVSELREFVEMLTEACHRQLPDSKVLWYDSVTRSGQLKWQDQLNEENSLFFDACDGIFLNYCWTPEKLASSQELAGQKGRPFDVFVGIDVFGRGCPGGGGFNTRQALEQAQKHSLSAAIFAPGWVLENLGPTDFDDNDCRFWAKLHDLCQPSANSRLPLSSAFCQGHGEAFFCMGKDMTGRPWYNMSLQQRQPERCRVYGFEDPCRLATRPSLNTCLSSAYLGGCSVELSAHLTRPLQTVTFRLFSLRAKLDETLYCSYTFRENSDVPCDIYLVLTFGSGLLTRRAVMGAASDSPHSSAEQRLVLEAEEEPAPKKAKQDVEELYVSALGEKDLEAFKDCLWFYDLQQGGGQQVEVPWKTRHFKMDTTKLAPSSGRCEEESVSIAVCLASPPGDNSTQDQSEEKSNQELHEDIHRASVLMGHLQVFREQDLNLEAPSVTGIRLVKLEPGDFSLSADTKSTDSSAGNGDITQTSAEVCYLLQWDVEGSAGVDYFNVYMTSEGSPRLLGHTATTTFVTPVSAQFVHEGVVTVTVQPILSATGLPLALPRCATESVPLLTEGSGL